MAATLPTLIPTGAGFRVDHISDSLRYVGELDQRLITLTGTAETDRAWRVRREYINAGVLQVDYALSGAYRAQWSARTSYFGAVSAFTNTKAVLFDGVNDYAATATKAFNFERTQPFSVSLWVKMSSLSGTGILCGTMSNLTSRGWQIARPLAGDGTWKFNLVGTNTTSEIEVWSAFYTLPVGVWTHLAVTYDGSATAAGVKIFVNGGQLFNNVIVNNLTATTIPGNAFAVGAGAAGGTPSFATIDEVSIWTVALSNAQVTSLYNSGHPGDLTLHAAYASLLSWYRMGDSDNYPTIYDAQPAANHMVLFNSTSANIVTDHA